MLPIDGRYSFKNNEKIVAMKRTRVKERSIGRVSGCHAESLSIWVWFATLQLTPPFFFLGVGFFMVPCPSAGKNWHRATSSFWASISIQEKNYSQPSYLRLASTFFFSCPPSFDSFPCTRHRKGVASHADLNPKGVHRKHVKIVVLRNAERTRRFSLLFFLFFGPCCSSHTHSHAHSFTPPPAHLECPSTTAYPNLKKRQRTLFFLFPDSDPHWPSCVLLTSHQHFRRPPPFFFSFSSLSYYL